MFSFILIVLLWEHMICLITCICVTLQCLSFCCYVLQVLYFVIAFFILNVLWVLYFVTASTILVIVIYYGFYTFVIGFFKRVIAYNTDFVFQLVLSLCCCSIYISPDFVFNILLLQFYWNRMTLCSTTSVLLLITAGIFCAFTLNK